MVEGVARLREQRPEEIGAALDAIGELARAGMKCLAEGELTELGRLMNANQRLLSSLSVSTEGIERACALARDAGALGAKLTGSGGGGAVIALAEDVEPVLSAFRGAGLACFATRVRARSADLTR
jgi:mevalonate kinase